MLTLRRFLALILILFAAPAFAQFGPFPPPPPAPFPPGAPFPPPGGGGPFAQPQMQPPGPLQVIGQDPVMGPICAGPLGPGPCEAVARFVQIQYMASQMNLPVISVHPQMGPMCNGPLGPGPCQQVAVYLATQQIAQQQIQPVNIPGQPGMCIGPLGPGPCDAIRTYLMQSSIGGMPGPAWNPNQAQMVNNAPGPGGPQCGGPFGNAPCALLAQTSLDQFNGAMPTAGSFGLPPGLNSQQQRAVECARRTGIDVTGFAGCMGQQVVLPREQQAVLDCAVASRDSASFANCAAPNLGINLSDDQKKVANCAMRSNGDESAFTSCARGEFLNRALTDEEQAILACAENANGDSARFVSCSSGQFLDRQQQAVMDCALSADDATSFATCAAPNVGVKLSDDQRVLAKCAMQSDGDSSDFAACAGAGFLNANLGQNEQAVLNCATNAGGDSEQFASCAAARLLGQNMSREQQIALQCAAQSGGDAGSWAACAGANMFGLQLNPEQQIAVQCVVSTGGQPYAAAGCMASRLTMRELTKCMSDGFGGDGCFGDNNDLVGKNGWVGRTMGQIAGGPNSVINNPGQIWGGDNSFVRNPSQIWGGPNSFVRNPSQIWGGPNSVFNNPGQLLPQPKPVQVGSIGGKRICIPWC